MMCNVESTLMLSNEKTKEILGEEFAHCTDEEIEKIRDAAYMFADIFIEGILDAREVLSND
jgi:hypothetical protein